MSQVGEPGVPGTKAPHPRLRGNVPGEDCKDAIRELYTFLDGELTEARREAISGHLDGCHPCLEAFEFEAELRLVVSHHCRATVPEALKERIATLIADDRGGPAA